MGIFHNFSLKYVFWPLGQNLYIWSILVFFLESARIFTWKMIDKTFNTLFSQICPKPPIFLNFFFIISLFYVRFQFRLNHMTVLLILHVTKEKNIKKYFRQLYRGYKIAKKLQFFFKSARTPC